MLLKRRYLVLYLVSLASFLRTQAHVILSPALVSMRSDLDTSTAMVGLTLSVYGLVLTFSQIGYGPVVDRFDSKRVLVAGLVLFAVTNVAAYMTQGILWLLVWRALQALGIAAASSVGIALIADLYQAQEQGRAISIFESFNAIGGVSGTVVGAAIAAWFGWRADFLFLALAAMVLIVLVVRTVPARAAPAQRVGLAEMSTIVRDAAALGAILLGFAAFFAVYALLTLIPVLLTERFSLGQGQIGLSVAMLPFASIFGALLGGRMADSGGPARPLLVGTGAMAATLVLLSLLSATAPATTLALLLVITTIAAFGFAMGMALPPQLKLMVSRFPTLRGTAGALLYFARFSGATAAPVIVGLLNDALGTASGVAATAAVLIAIGIAGIALCGTSVPLAVTVEE